ncbi:acyl-CoA dehydrogenase family protein [Kitasatospora sp. NPDC056783]|uniref:acyl-CoA dehydrogenase family protein n=1 Tax=Kitasatospora sp. NPDC056783 TaxID=3345943 RepID=UPI0036A40148
MRVPADRVPGRVGGGFLVLGHVLKREILCSFSVSTGEMRHRLERCPDRAETRMSFGRPIGSCPSAADRIVDTRIRLETAREWL